MIRFKCSSDEEFIHSTWITNLHSAKPYSFTPWNIFCTNQNDIIDNLQPISNTLIYCIAEDPNLILGYLCYSHLQDNLIVHFGYVKEKFRNNKIMSELLYNADHNYKNKLITLTHATKMYVSLSKKFTTTFDPYIINKLQILNEELND